MALGSKKNIDKKKKPKAQYEGAEAIKGLRVNYLIIFLSGLVILIAAILTYLLIIQNIYGNYELSEIIPSEENIREFRYTAKVGLLYSQYTSNMLGGDEDWVEANIDTWKNFLKNMKIEHEVFSDLDLEEGRHLKYNLIILAGSKSLSDLEVMRIKRYIDAGGSVLATGGVATFSDEAKWRGWDFFKETFGMKFTKELSPDEVLEKSHTLRGNLPITAGIPTGYILQIATWDRPVYAEVLEPRTTQVSYWYDYSGERGLVDEQIKKSAGIANGFYGKGRFVWYGFELNSVVGSNEDYIYLGKLVKNSIDWLTYNPISFLKDWPEPYAAAAIYAPTIKDNINNINAVKSTVKEYNSGAVIIMESNLALQYPKQTAMLSKIGDIVPIIDLDIVDQLISVENDINSKEIQQADISYIRDSLSKIINKPITGITPYYGYYDQATLDIMAEENISFIITDSLTDRSVPNKEILDGKDIFIITNTSRDDIVVMDEFGLTDPEFQKYTYFEDIDRIIFEGGLYVLKTHNNYLLKPQYKGIFKDIPKYMRANNVWVTSIPELLTWWNSKSGVELKYEKRGKRRIVVEVSNHKYDMDEEFVVQINFNKEVKNIKISTELIFTQVPEFALDTKTHILYLYIKDLEADESRTFLIDFENVGEQPNQFLIKKID
ncbi:MAG: hypothetical protein L3J41_01630 [Melioribacteraceae bacterium]|nr:hypothetical protein [Melioribacteraceae bacterium]